MGERGTERTGDSFDWQGFRAGQEELFRAADLPRTVTESEDRWVDFLRDGRLEHHAGSAPSPPKEVSDSYSALVRLATRYFEEGGLFLTPMALRSDDQARLAERFGGPESRPAR